MEFTYSTINKRLKTEVDKEVLQWSIGYGLTKLNDFYSDLSDDHFH